MVAGSIAIANNSNLILTDEPAASLDAETGSIIMDLLYSYAN